MSPGLVEQYEERHYVQACNKDGAHESSGHRALQHPLVVDHWDCFVDLCKGYYQVS